jgi:superfamily I DNA/RNA helicase
VIVHDSVEHALAELDPMRDTLVLARTNEYASRLAQMLDDLSMPWCLTKQIHRPASARAAGVSALVNLHNGKEIDGEAWWRLLHLLPSNYEGTPLFIRGTKKFFEEEQERRKCPKVSLASLALVGGTEAAKNLIRGDGFLQALKSPAARVARAALKHGVGVIEKPNIKVGTFHSSKGMGAEHVLAYNRIPLPVQRGIFEQTIREEERRLWYVTETRARDRLTIMEDGQYETFTEVTRQFDKKEAQEATGGAHPHQAPA